MEIEELIAKTIELMDNQYGRDLMDFYDEDELRQALLDGEEPQAMVDEVASDLGLPRRQGTLAHDHIESLVQSWRKFMAEQLGEEYAAQVTDEQIREWLKAGKEPEPVEDDEDTLVLLNELAEFIEDDL